MIENVKNVVVKYNGATVGALAQLDNNKIAFQYDENWLKNGFTISPFSLPLEKRVFVNEKSNFGGLFGVFFDSLPDGWGELLMNRKLAQMGLTNVSILTKLTIIGENGLGGLTYEPNQNSEKSENLYELDALAQDVQKVLNDEYTDKDLDKIFCVGGSSGGARPKAHVKIDGQEWIIKFPCSIDPPDIGKREYDANVTARRCGINVNDFRLFNSKICAGYFGAKRFDRVNGKRGHMISLSALLETSHRVPNLDYTHLFQVAQRICENADDCIEVYKRMCFNVLFHNTDDHSKNFAFLFDEKLGGYKISPAYDTTKTPLKPLHEMSVLGKDVPSRDDLMQIGTMFEIKQNICKKIIDDIENVTRGG